MKKDTDTTGGAATETTSTPPTRTRKATKVMVLCKEEGAIGFVEPSNIPDSPYEFKDKDDALRWIKDNGEPDCEYCPIRALDDWRTVTVEQTEVRSLK